MSPKDSRTPPKAIVEAQIDDNLRKIFEEDTESDLPPHLAELVARLGEVDMPASAPDAEETVADDDPTTGVNR